MGKVAGFLEIDRCTHAERPVTERLRDYRPIAEPLPDERQRLQASRCMDCGVAFCQTGRSFGRARVSGCPLHNLIPEWNDLVWRGLWDQAASRMRITNPMPEFTGRVCPALCEAACNLGRDRGATSIKDDELAISDHEWADGGPAAFDPDRPRPLAGRSVAVVGSGPAGLACAWELCRLGADVTVHERSDAPGGLLMYGIPTMKLDKTVVRRRADWLAEQGVAFKTGSDVSDPVVAGAVAAESDAVVLAVGAGEARRLSVPGADLAGVVMAVDYLTANTKAVEAAGEDPAAVSPAISAAGLDVVIVGGGDTGTDCVACALRQGARSVRQLEFMPRPPEQRLPSNPWPEWPVELKVDYGQEEAETVQGDDPRTWAADTVGLVDAGDGSVGALRFRRLDWSGGTPVSIEGSEEEIPAQLVLIAMGFAGPVPAVLEAFSVETRDDRPLPLVGEGGHEAVSGCAVPVFVAGDCRGGASLVVSAMADGLACAREVAAALS
ncbi:glutamate synthase subunit beta [Atopobiaceae bacterium 24-176]